MPDMDSAERHKAALLDATRLLLSCPEGRHYLKWLIKPTLFYKPGMPEGHAEAAFREGMRSIGQAVFSLAVETGAAGEIFKEEE